MTKEQQVTKFAQEHADEILSAIREDDNIGFCVSCGETHYCIEPDAREYQCESCETSTVYGAEELLFHM